MNMDLYIAGKTEILQTVLDQSELSAEDKLKILQLNANGNPTR